MLARQPAEGEPNRPLVLYVFAFLRCCLTEPLWNRYGCRMADYTLKSIPKDLHERLRAAAAANFRSVNQEALARLSRSFDADDARMSALHARWIHEALASGAATPLKPGELDRAFERGLVKSKGRKQAKAA